MRVLVTREIHPDAVHRLKEQFDLMYFQENRPLDGVYLTEHLHTFDGVLSTVSEKIGAALLDRLGSRLKVISNMASGLDNVDTVSAARLGIRVFNIPETTIDSTADLTLALTLGLLRQVAPARRYLEQGHWRAWDPMIFQGRTLRGLAWGVFGMGRIGQAVAARAAAFGCRILYCDPMEGQAQMPAGLVADRVSFEALLAQADVISLHAPLTPETDGVFDAAAFESMKQNAYLVNMARGPLVRTADLVDALKTGRIAGAALDVFDPEPLPADHDLLHLDNLVATPHIGTATLECRRDMAVKAAENLINFLVRK